MTTTVHPPVAATTVPLLANALAHVDFSLDRVSDVVSSDAGLAARLLAVANSASFGLPRQVTEIRQAIGLVGADLVQTLAIAGATRLLDAAGGLPHARSHSIEVACAARLLAERSGLSRPDAFAAGLLHDIGEVLLWQRDPAGYAAAYAQWADIEDQLRGERSMFDADHATVAREQLADWKLPGQVVDAVGDHHRPDLCYPDLSTLVVAAEELCDPECPGSRRLELLGVPADDLAALREVLGEHSEQLAGLLVGG